MSVMSLTTSPMRPAASFSSRTVALVHSASLTALVAMAFACTTWRSISVTDAASSSAAEAISRTFSEAANDAVVAPAVLLAALSAAPASRVEAATICSQMRASSDTVASTSALNRLISAEIRSCRKARAWASSMTVRPAARSRHAGSRARRRPPAARRRRRSGRAARRRLRFPARSWHRCAWSVGNKVWRMPPDPC